MKNKKFSLSEVDSRVRQIYREVVRNPRKALTLADKGLSDAKQQRFPVAIAKMTLARAHSLREIGNYSESLRAYAHAAKLFRQQNMIDESWRTSIGKMDALDQMGRYKDALTLAKHTAKYFKNAGHPFWEAKILANTGNIYQHLDRYDRALHFYKKAYPILSREQPGDGYILLFNQATTHLCAGHPREAIDLLTQCLQYFQEQNLTSFLARTHYNLSYGFYLQGKYQNALFHLTEARTRLVRLKDWSFLASCYLDEAEIYLRLNQVEEAIVSARKARKFFLKLKMPYELAESNSFLGIALLRQEQTRSAFPFLREAQKFFSSQKNIIKTAEIDSHLALGFLKEKDLDQARTHLKKAFEKFSSAKIHSRMLLTVTFLAQIELTEGKPNNALKILDKVSKWIAEIHLPWILLPYFLTLGRAQLNAGISGSRKSLDRAIRLIESMRSEIPAEDLRISYFQDKLLPYHLLIEKDLKLEKPKADERSFEYAERARSRVLQDLLEGSLHFENLERDSQSLATEVNAMRSESWRRTLAVSADPGKWKRRDPEKRIIQILRRAQRLRKDHARVSTKIKDIQKLLLPHQTLISYYRIDDAFHAFVVNSKGLTVHPGIAKNSELISSWHYFRFQLEHGRNDPERSLKASETHLSQLYSKLLAPLEERIAGAQILTIIPHGWLHTFPFHCLHDDQGFLADRYQFSYAPSISVYAHCLMRESNTKGMLLVGHSDSLAPWIDQEISEIKSIYPNAEVFTAESARARLLQEKSQDCALIHIASHGRFLQNRPFLSGIHLADGWLTLPQIYQMKLHARLVTLSGCETGSNEVSSGDELLGLTRGFLYAGASSLLVSLWRVFDVSTAYFMKAFYSTLSSGSSHIEAWHAAVLETKRKWPHPYYWAPFVLMGKI
jgi:CHAT domain-containing protein